MSLKTNVFLKGVAREMDTCTAHHSLVSVRFVTCRRVHHVDRIAGKVCHVLRKLVVLDVNVRQLTGIVQAILFV